MNNSNVTIRNQYSRRTGARKYGISYRAIDDDSKSQLAVTPNEISQKTRKLSVRNTSQFSCDPVFEQKTSQQATFSKEILASAAETRPKQPSVQQLTIPVNEWRYVGVVT